MKTRIAKIFLTALAVGYLMSLEACIKDDTSDCPDGVAVSLRFSFTKHVHNAEPTDLFAEWVDDVTVYVFDAAGLYVTSATAHRASLGGGNTLSLDLDEGEYRIVAWGNLEENEYGIVTHNQARAGYAVTVLDNHPRVSDLFHGMTAITVANKDITGEIPLTRNTNIVRIYISGLPAARSIPGKDYSVRVTGSNVQYDFENNPAGETAATYIPAYSSETVDGTYYDVAEFKVQRLLTGDDVALDIYDRDGVKYHDEVTSRILAAFDGIETDDDLDRHYEYDLFYEMTPEGTFVFVGTNIKDWEGPSMPGEL